MFGIQYLYIFLDFWKVTKHRCIFSIFSRFLSFLSILEIILSFFSRLDFQVQKIENIKEKVLFLEGNLDNLCLIRVPNVRGICG